MGIPLGIPFGIPLGIPFGMGLGIGGNWKPKPGTGGGIPMVLLSRMFRSGWR